VCEKYPYQIIRPPRHDVIHAEMFTLIKQTLLSFPQFLSVEAVILHKVVHCRWNFTYFIDQPPKSTEKIKAEFCISENLTVVRQTNLPAFDD
jgi:hypothetical protein